MKKYFKLNLLPIVFLLFLGNIVNAQSPGPPCRFGNCNDGDQGQGDGSSKGTPIDGYLPVLIITAVTIAGIYSYKQRKLIQK